MAYRQHFHFHEYVNKVKILPEVKKEFMKFDELMAYARQEGMRMGLEEGREKGLEEGREKGLEEGRYEGQVQAIMDVLELYGQIPEQIRVILENEKDKAKLSQWLKLAVKVNSVSEFMEKI